MREIGPFRVLRAPGTDGGTGGGTDCAARTHLCRAADGLLVVVEELHPAQAPDAAARRRFARRARAARRIDGPWTLPVLDADPDAERPWLATAHAPPPTWPACCAPPARCPSPPSAAWARGSPGPWPPGTPPESPTAGSNPPASWSPRTARC